MERIGYVAGGHPSECFEEVLLAVFLREVRVDLRTAHGPLDVLCGRRDVLGLDDRPSDDDVGCSRFDILSRVLRGDAAGDGDGDGDGIDDLLQNIYRRLLAPHLGVDAHVHADVGCPEGLHAFGALDPVGDVDHVNHDFGAVLATGHDGLLDGGIIGKTEHGDDVSAGLGHDLDFEGPGIHGLGVGDDLLPGELPSECADRFGPFAFDQRRSRLYPIDSSFYRFAGDDDGPVQLHEVQGYLERRHVERIRRTVLTDFVEKDVPLSSPVYHHRSAQKTIITVAKLDGRVGLIIIVLSLFSHRCGTGLHFI